MRPASQRAGRSVVVHAIACALDDGARDSGRESNIRHLAVTGTFCRLASALLFQSRFDFASPRTLTPMKRFAPLGALLAAVSVAQAADVPENTDATPIEGHPLTSVVITQCNLIVAVYMTMPDGKLLRFDKSSSVDADKMITMAYSATRSERVEVACESNGIGVVGYEKHEPL
jgi:hypothetical protein